VFDEVHQLVLQVRGGEIYALIDGVSIKLSPREISELRQVLAEAQAVAFMQRGGQFEE
jgi:hypothetical protein